MYINSFILLQSAARFAAGGALTILIIGLAVFIGIFFLGRAILLWYWKVDVIVKNQEYQTSLLEYQNQLIAQQVDLLKKINAKSGSNPV